MTEEEQQEIDIPQERAIDQRFIGFEEDALAAALSEKGGIYISLPGICTALGLDSKGQLQRIRRTSNLQKGLRKIPLKTPKRGTQQTNCLLLGKVAIWLAGIETDRMTNRQAAAKINRYQEELEPIATQVFFGNFVAAPPPTVSSSLILIEDTVGVEAFLEEHIRLTIETSILPPIDIHLTQQDTKLDYIINLLTSLVDQQETIEVRQITAEQEIEKIDARTQHLSPQHKRLIKEKVDRLVQTSKHADQPLTYISVYGKLKKRYRVVKYDEIADELYEQVMAFLDTLTHPDTQQPRLF